MSRLQRRRRKKDLVYKTRLLVIRNIILFAFIGLIVRLFYIQVTKHNFYNAEVVKQRQVTIPVSSGRGIIYDRNFIPLTDKVEQEVVTVFPQHFIGSQENLEFLQAITGEEYKDLENKIKNSKLVLEFPLTNKAQDYRKKAANIKGLFIIKKTLRYEDDGLLNHVIGYVNQVDYKGMSGIERALDGTLSGNSIKSLIATLDGRKQFLPGEGYLVADSIKKNENLRLTIDHNIQSIIENAIDKKNKDGAIIVSDIETGEILGMASRPNFNPNNILEHLNSKGDELYNKAIQMSFPPGSIFKIVVAAEALRQDPSYMDEVFYCQGYEVVGEVDIKCSSYESGGHEEISIDRAFSESCNSVFIQLAERLGTANVINMAESLGLNKIVNIGLVEEQPGNLPKGDKLLGAAYGNIGIGQGEILVTPLQVNQLTQIIGNKGLKKPLYLMKDIVDNNHTSLKTPNIQEEAQVLDIEIAGQIQKWMEKVMLEGTGSKVQEISSITAGKTGSAEASEKGKRVVHAWFTGYYPANKPKYAVTVFIQRGGSGSGVAVPIFTEIVESMINEGF